MIIENRRDFLWASRSEISKVCKGIFNLASSQISFTFCSFGFGPVCLSCLADFLHCRFKSLYWSMSWLSLTVCFFSTRFHVWSLIHSCLTYLRNPRTSSATMVWASLNVSHLPVPSASAVKWFWIATWYSTSGIRSLETSNREFGWLVKDCFFNFIRQVAITGLMH